MKIILETPRLVLRTFTTEDAAMLLDLCQDAAVMRYTGEPPMTELAEAERMLQDYILEKQYHENGFGYYAIHLIKNGIFIGWCGFKAMDDIVLLDCRLRKRFWYKGFGTEICQAVLSYGFTKMNFEHIHAKAHEKNAAAVEVMKNIGLEFEKTKKIKRQRFVTYGLSHTQWKAQSDEIDAKNG